ncbi:hypothetical protein [Georgenia muralis]|uniref:DUF308 domain-containing protein n=1 Tax=Georgenia muralis TaxID=154117 RepID=A0A3N4Z5M7_9MICO|nr:hypothetical protein [Georgenia muralis]RPF28669.1 hypothetical protein EDD32_3208 [Georgenia muralis]
MAGPNREGEPPGEPRELDDAAVAARWAELTASLGELAVPPPEHPTPGEPGPDRPGPGAVPGDERPARPADLPGARVVRPAAPGPRDYVPDEDEDEGYEPPEPEPLTHADPAVTLGWVATIGAVMLGVVLSVVWRPVPDGVLGALALVLAGGVGLLLWRMPARRDRDDRSDGAVV